MSAAVKVGIAIAVVVVLVVGFWLVRPLFVDDVVDEDFPQSATLATEPVVPDGMSVEEVDAEMAAAAQTDVVEEQDMPGGEPVALASGAFTGTGRYESSGSATVYEVDGSSVLRLEDFSVTNGPDLRVLLAPVDAAGEPDIAGSTDLGQLRGNIGNQNYDIPDDLDLSQDLTVLIYCEPFSVLFASAPLS